MGATQMMQMRAVFGVLSFLGMVASLGAATVVLAFTLAVGERRLASATGAVTQWLFGGWGLGRKVLMAAGVLVTGYFAVLLGFSLASREMVLPVGEEKYFCEIDCHLAYAVTGVAATRSVGEPAAEVSTGSNFLVVSLRTRFDEKTISAHRGNSPLGPNPWRRVTLVDDEGQEYGVSESGQRALEAARGAGTPLSAALRPGEAYESKLVFEVPAGEKNLRVLVASPMRPEWLADFVIGDEQSFLHKKVFLAMPRGS